jgi:NAD+ synthase (glutamine-hydrolysing)
MALHAFDGKYDIGTIRKWLLVFVKKFFANQFKRSVAPDGPKVGLVAFSPRGDWRMPSDAIATPWVVEAEENVPTDLAA